MQVVQMLLAKTAVGSVDYKYSVLTLIEIISIFYITIKNLMIVAFLKSNLSLINNYYLTISVLRNYY